MIEKNKTSISDLPYNSDDYDFITKRYVDGLVKFIENSSAPITIALQGEWGSGKTSLMTRLHRALCSKENAPFIGVNINTWEYSMMSSPETTVYNILSKLVQELTGQNNAFKKKISAMARALYFGGRVVTKFVSPRLDGALEMIGPPTTDQNLAENDVSLAELRDELQKAIISRIVEMRKQGVIVFVDDLDRLNPPVAVEILELLKNVFTLDNCIFVLAIDYDVVVKGLEPKFGKLTHKNEREFRSFFDKIIQVPFSLPISSYQPMDFVFKSLVGIGFLKGIDTSDSNIKTRFASVVECSVGKNPRSIKRLINTLSLLECIAHSGSDSQKTEVPTVDEKLLNFIIVALQISYPQIYRLLVHKPAFTSWDREFAQKEGIAINSKDNAVPEWEDILEAACSSDKFLTQHISDITNLFSMIIEILGRSNITTSEDIGLELKQILDTSSVTEVNTSTNTEDFDKKALINKLHGNIVERMKQLRPDFTDYKLRNNTGNGGINFRLDNGSHFSVIFTPTTNSNNNISLGIRPDLHIYRPERMKGMSFDEIMQDEQLSSALTALDSVLAPLLKSASHFNGQTHGGQSTYFPSFIDELRYMHKNGHMDGEITFNPQYSIDLEKPSLFEDSKITDTIVSVLAANYDFRKSLKDWK